jgi:beta-mannosidase
MSEYLALHHGWTLTAAGSGDRVPVPLRDRVVPATVPGCVHTDLLAAGLIPDPLLGNREPELAWIGKSDWLYTNRFALDATDDERVDLVCAGLDTIAELELNGVPVGSTANMHRSYRFDVGRLLFDGTNELGVTFRSALDHAERLSTRLGRRPGAYPLPYNMIRKNASNFGWDWGPTFVTAGIWRPIGLHSWRIARLAGVRPVVTVEDAVGRVALHVEIERTGTDPLWVTARIDGLDTAVAVSGDSAIVEVEVPDAELWWPRGHGGQPTYPVRVILSTMDGVRLDTWQERIGFRTVELDTAPDADGTPFGLRINGELIEVRGVNWIPDDVFVSRVDDPRHRLGQACAAGVNLIRVWGGGIYESAAFYRAADELGLLVWQDFPFACAAYPEESPIAQEVSAEAREQVVRLAPHPSLVLWNGNNENIWGYWDWDWQASLDGRSWGEAYYFDTLPGIVAELDPTRPYWPGSPYSGDPAIHPNDPDHGPTHIWDVWNQLDYTHYRDNRPRFVAEFGYQAPPAMATLRRALDAAGLHKDSPGMLAHQKAADGNKKLERGLAEHFGVPDSFDDWHFLTSVNQARAIRLGIEHFRSMWPRCTGSVLWQLNDCWPAVSWSVIDYDGRRKPAWYAMREAYRERLLTIQPHEEGLAVTALNDTALGWWEIVELTRVDLSGRVLAAAGWSLAVGTRAATRHPLPAEIANAGHPDRELIVITAGPRRALWFFARDRDIAYPEPEFDAHAERSGDTVLVTVRARTLLRDMCLFADRVAPGAEVDRALVTLLPGESATFTVDGLGDADPEMLTHRPILRCVNDLTGSRP